jgi:hypothetical protein
MDPFNEARAVALMHFPCPPLPVIGNMRDDGSNAILNSHDMLSVFLITAFKQQNQQLNLERRLKQAKIDEHFRSRLEHHFADNKTPPDFKGLYDDMMQFTRQYLQSYHPQEMDIRVLSPDYISPSIRRHIVDYFKAQNILNGETKEYRNDELEDMRAESVLQECMRRVLDRHQGKIKEPVFCEEEGDVIIKE